MPSNLVWSWPLHFNSNISYILMGKEDLNNKRRHTIIGFNHGMPWYVKNMALGPQSRQKPWPTASVFVYLSPSGHVFNIAWQAMIKTYNPVLCVSQWNLFWPKNQPIRLCLSNQARPGREWFPSPLQRLQQAFWRPNRRIIQNMALKYVCCFFNDISLAPKI